MSAKKQSAHSLAIALMVLVVLVVMVVAVGVLGSQHLNLVRANLRSTTAIYAAEAGIARSLVELKANRGWSAGFQNVEMVGEWDPGYSVAVTNNNLGGGLMTAPDGTEVPAGCVYLLATGTCKGVNPRRVAVMLKAGGGGGFRYVIASGGTINLSAGCDITGSIKATGSVTTGGNVNLHFDNTAGGIGGNLLSAGDVTLGSLKMDEGQGQVVRAKGQISGDATNGTTEPYSSGTDVLPFDHPDGSDSLPHPDLATLLAPGTVVHDDYFDEKELVLAGKTHHFPAGLKVGKVVGPGTIVVGETGTSTSATFDQFGNGNTPENVNIIGLGDASLKFTRDTRIVGLIYSEGMISAKELRVVAPDDGPGGYVIACGGLGGVSVKVGASLTIKPNPGLKVPGFENWFGGSGAGGIIQVMSWQRL